MTEIHGITGYGPELTDAGAIRLRFLIVSTYYFLPPVDLFQDVLTDIAHLNKYHPVRDFLANVKWDGNPRIDNWLHDYAGAEDTPYNRAIGRIFLMAAVRRVRQPGIKFDTMLVFESPTQGKNKSSAMRLLAMREEWFTDNLPLGADPKEVIEQISGIWIVEFAELDGMATRERERITAFLSRQVDKARPAYGRRRETVKRQFVACGTTNDTEYLPQDERRMWPVRVDLFNLDRLAKDVEQLWAEAAYYEAEGESITLQQDLWPAAAAVRAERLFENPYQATLAEHFSNSTFVVSKEVWDRLGIPADRQKKAARDVGQAMHRLGFARKQCRRDGDPKGCKRGDRYYTS
jgi:predicted P-loop ATPase